MFLESDQKAHPKEHSFYPDKKRKDNLDEDRVLCTLKLFKVFSDSSNILNIQNVATKDIVDLKIQDSLPRALEVGLQKVLKFVLKCLLSSTYKGNI